MFIYILHNIQNNKVIVGQSVNIKERWSSYRRLLKKNTYPNHHLQSAWNKYGESSFEFYVIDEAASLEDLDKLEKYYITEIFESGDPKNGYNLRDGGRDGAECEMRKQQREHFDTIKMSFLMTYKFSDEWISQGITPEMIFSSIPDEETRKWCRTNWERKINGNPIESFVDFLNKKNK